MLHSRTAVICAALGLLAAAARASDVGGTTSGLTATRIVCRNVTSGQTVRSAENLIAWSCADLGLSVATGDRVLTGVQGFLPAADVGLVAGSAGLPADFVSHAVPLDEAFSAPMRVGDLDGDGDPDLVTTRDFAWYENLGPPHPNLAQHVLDSPELGASAVRLADVNGDGRLDIVAAFGGNTDQLAWYQNLGGDPPQFTLRPIDQRDDWKTFDMDVADVDGDGDVDFFVEQNAGPMEEISWLEDTGGGVYVRHVIVSKGGGVIEISNLLAFDADGDADLDLVLADVEEETVAWYENEGAPAPGFTVRREIDDFKTMCLFSGDVDGDGDLDILTETSSSPSDGEVRWYENLGGGAFAVHVIGEFPEHEFDTTNIGDFNADGRLDVALAGQLEWLRNEGGSPPAFSLQPVEGTIRTLRVEAVDLDGDGRLDLVDSDTGQLVWHENRIGLRLSVTGMGVRRVTCRNVTTNQTVDLQTSEAAVDCEELGLVVNAGDEIGVFARGEAE